MLSTWDLKSDELLSLTGLIDFFERRGECPLSGHDLDEAAQVMRHVLNDRGDICRYIIDNLSVLLHTDGDDYTPDAIVLYRGKHFFVRVVIWLPDGMKGQRSSITDSTIHDHNFNFMTLGLFGPGYPTDVWEYDYASACDQTGAMLPVRGEGRLQLEEGRVFYFRKSVDIHRQLAPSGFSVSLNVIETDNITNMQYDFEALSPGRPDRLHVKHLLNPPFVEQLVGILRASSLRERAYAVLTESGLWQQGGLPTQILQRARQLLSASDSTIG